ncbi:MAG: alpha-galactosidase [Butyrivibrio sp.]|nr:alpha-galactosidase [Butyrivibrio sp.]
MGIVFNEDSLSFKLDTDNTSYVIGIADEEKFIGHCYYGARVSDDDLTYMLRTAEAPFVPSKNARERGSFFDLFPVEYPGNGLGDYREGAVEVRCPNQSRAVNFTYKGHNIYAGKKALPGLPATFGSENECQSLELYAEDSVLGLEATLVYSVFEKEDVITRSVSVTNRNSEPIHLTKVMSASVDMDDEDYQMISLHGSWARERQIEYRPVAYGRQNAASFKGESSHQEHPFIALASKDIAQDYGKVYAFHFVYSGNFLAQVEKGQFDTVRVIMGIHPYGFDWKLDKDECFTVPEVVMTFSDTGLGTMTRNLHDLYRNHLIRSPYKDRKRPILINNWEATYFDFNTEKLLDIAREAKKCGIEMLVMDDGWFGHRNDDSTSLGDWKVNEEKLPGGLPYLVSEVNKIGLKFGIWFEPEMISPESDLYREHSDWAISIPGREATRSRNQLVLDLSNPEVVDYVYEAVASVLRSANIEYVKWDMNRQLTDLHSNYLPDDRQGELYHRYVLAVYELQERLTKEFPELLLENCSGGGARFDPGMLYYSPQIWCSDDTDAIERLKIQEGTALIYPLSAMGAHVSDCPNHTVGRVTPFETRGNVALCGTFGYELDITKIPESDRAQIPAQVAAYHKYNDLVRNGDYYRIASYSENKIYDCYGVVAKDKSEALIIYVSVLNRPNFHSRRICVPGLDAKKRYRVEGTDQVFYGDTLMNAGLIILNLWGDFQSKLIHLVGED